MADIPMPETAKVVLTRIELSARAMLSREMLYGAAGNLQARLIDDCGQRLAVQLKTYILGIESDRIVVSKRWPCNWWQAVRARWMPAWWLAGHPVQYEEIDISERRYAAVCPHIHIETNMDTHINWMARVEPDDG